MSENFIRKYKLTIEASNGKAVIIQGQHIEFDVTLSADSKLNELDLKIYNLSRETIGIFDELDAVVKLEVGWGDNPLGLIFKGNKIHSSTKPDGVHLITEVLASEGAVTVREARTQVALPENSTVEAVIRKIVADSMPEIKALNLTGDGLKNTYALGKTVSGSSKAALDKICSTNNLRWHISQNETLNVLPLNGDIKRKAILVTPVMIKNTPEKTSEEVEKLKDDLNVPKKLGLNLTLQLNPAFLAGGLIKIEGTRFADGTYLIEKVKHSGSFEGNNWDTSLECKNY